VDKAILVVHVLVAISLVILILLQRSSTDGGAAFGGGSQQSLLGTTGSAPLLTKVTVGLVTIFFITSLSLAYINRYFSGDEQILIPAAETISEELIEEVPEVIANPIDDDIPAAPVLDDSSSDIPAIPAITESDSDIPVPAQ